jgi:phenylacetate-CoA ligase
MGYKNKVTDFLVRRRWLNAFRMGANDMAEFILRINEFRPDFILAYAEAIYQFTRFIEDQNIRVRSPKCIITSAGVLYPFMREKIQAVFRCPVYNYYGSREVGAIACECEEQNGLHVSDLTHYLEILKPDGTPALEGEVGDIVISLMTNRAMPLMRYRIGDVGAIRRDVCPCGRSMVRLIYLAGRSSDMFIRKDGGAVHGEYFTHLLYDIPAVRKFQVVQESLDEIVFRVISRGVSIPLEREAEIRQKVELVLGGPLQVRFEYVNDLPATNSGKYRYTVSRVVQESLRK